MAVAATGLKSITFHASLTTFNGVETGLRPVSTLFHERFRIYRTDSGIYNGRILIDLKYTSLP
jgi:hypothetical protein